MTDSASTPKHTALHQVHEQLGARFTDFGGWDMPLKYGKELDEHRAVRETVGVFDLSHMGEVEVSGPQAAELLDYALISRLSAVKVGKAKYSMLCTEDGGIVDDLITYRLADDDFLVVPNAGNAPRVAEALAQRAEGFDVTVVDQTAEKSLVAIQGPKAAEVMHAIVENVTDAPEASGATEDVRGAVDGLGYYAAFKGIVAGQPALIARTGYTGEDGFEIIVDNDAAEQVWNIALAKATELDGLPCGLAARDTLRLEAGMPLYGNELNDELTPVDAGLGILAATKSKDSFVGRDAIVAAKEKGAARVLIGLQGEGRRAARSGYAVLAGEGEDAQPIGEVTSGALSPTLGYPVAMAYVDKTATEEGGAATVGQTVQVDIRGKQYPYQVVEMPFYQREK
ncbi:glycine cleavage system aminomethyltransferase GcvT [Corynebacterium urealyticum]|uniref:Aminomethyltransferase n=1 Tax=Corynebacterium urealyticum (strain ATCC 43042 / DSM 7109) TaxID=504474 RepID=B1VHV2_CORU7|nr:glycine cleavage system aminomethyltransferase GcvT [Corynebacterium urealyticum]QQC42672.1 glycine cleavage system aminomethyltransferase GcvT [Corynebacterium urealyticum]CAQ05752.1 glycine cleavage system T protein [Corynebacterium urealyticum DSM 7109]SNV91070.1 glycine cleavage system aminomethyltransferase T [Corynebacterium urealyticum]